MEWIALMVVILALPGIVLLLAFGMFAGIGKWHMDRRYKRNRRTLAQSSRMTTGDLLERLSGTSVFDDEDKIGAWFEKFFEENPEAWNYHEQ